ncbi:MAG: class II aldolase/adducin family protein [Bdellovibrionales bacterium]
MRAEPGDFSDFRAFAAAVGRNPLYAQGAGGNVSIKHDGAMWIKASGAWLSDAARQNIFAVINHEACRSQLDRAGDPVYERLDSNPALRPSIETSLHAAMPQRIVVHVHAVDVMALAVRHEAEALCREKLGSLHFAFIPYTRPGWPLTQALCKLLRAASPKIIVLGNHGLVVAGETVTEVKTALAQVTALARLAPREGPPADISFLQDVCGKKWRLPKHDSVHNLGTDPVSRGFAAGGSLYPDHVVFLGRGCTATAGTLVKNIDPAKHAMLIVSDKGVLLRADLPEGGEAMAECLEAVLARIPPGARLNYFTSRDEDELINWDAEKYRQGTKP